MAGSLFSTRAAYRYTIRSRYRYYQIPIQGIKMTHSKRSSKSILTSSIWEKSNNNITKYHHANHKIPVYSNKMRKFDMWTLPWQAMWQFPLHIITAQAVAVGCLWCSWWQFSPFQCRIASLWIIRLRGYRDMGRIVIGIEIWYQYWYWYWKICKDMQPYSAPKPYCQLDSKEHILVKFYLEFKTFIQGNALESVICEMTAILSQPQCVNFRLCFYRTRSLIHGSRIKIDAASKVTISRNVITIIIVELY